MTSKVFVYEHISAGELIFESGPGFDGPRPSMLREGYAMLSAVVDDFLAAGCQVQVLHDPLVASPPGARCQVVRSRQEAIETFRRMAGDADYGLLIAPETGGVLARLADEAARYTTLVSPDAEFIARAADKRITAQILDDADVPTPLTRDVALESSSDLVSVPSVPAGLEFPLVVKPSDGAGSEGCLRLDSEIEWRRPDVWQSRRDRPTIVQAWVEGQPVSTAVLCAGDERLALPTATQALDENLLYQGGQLPVDSELAERAQTLALRAIAALGPTTGLVGVDMVLGDDDQVIEINPRLTTSYIGLRQVVTCNLAEAMMIAASEHRLPPCPARKSLVEFRPDAVI